MNFKYILHLSLAIAVGYALYKMFLGGGTLNLFGTAPTAAKS